MNPLQKMRLMVARGIVKLVQDSGLQLIDRKSTRLNSSHT